eukprot:TRINITY_DN1571_c0_g1_i14.p1 TRINITY_DN1571_c0_g1~~TRINITY_DN1571_c0_g1_i14.p1  ORF type:complete len:381 (+),score=70.14 TRINITY_DN1571_c0_g1_i14:328-1470(+)
MDTNMSPQRFFSSPFKLSSNSPDGNLPMTPEWNLTPNFCLDNALFTGNNSSNKTLQNKHKNLLSITRKGKSIAKNFKRKIKQQILGDLGTSERMIDTLLKQASPSRQKAAPESFSPATEMRSEDTKLSLFESEVVQSMIDCECQEPPVIVRKLFGESTSEQIHDDTKSPNIRERCLKNAEIFKSHFSFNLPIPITNKSSPKQDNTNPFSELKRNSSEFDFSNGSKRASLSDTVLDYSRSPAVMRTSGQLESFEDYYDMSKKSESRFETEFEVLGEIGKGHFGVVTRCRNRLDGLEYAIKITSHKWRSDYGKKEALQEVFALSALSVCDDNPYIVKYFNGWVEDSKLYIVVTRCVTLDCAVQMLVGLAGQEGKAADKREED